MTAPGLPPALRRWFHEPWMWLVVAIPALTVVAGAVTLFLAATGSDELVRDDFRKDGIAIYADPARDAAAAAAGATARLEIDAARTRLDLDLALAHGDPPRQLLLVLSHATRAELDRMTTLTGRQGRYSGVVEALPPGRWYLEVTPPDRRWRLRGSIDEGESVVEFEAPGVS